YSVSGTVDGRVKNGAILTVTASNTATSKTAAKKYTVIIKGDTNCNGRTDSGDAVVLSRNFLYGVALSDAVKLAGDMNGNGRIDSGDAVVMMRNYLYGGSK
ncbi:MAG: dockerin type I repeat-containing protein, partial [Clostridia bacterium]|nr:dockerin type I repeat-containing protein [Clostridia bacterium]